MPNKLTFIGLNEFNLELISEMARLLPKGNYLSRLLEFQKIESTTEDELESGFLEPWVQWVGIQTGTPSTVHGVKNLGDISDLKQPQLWERLSSHGKSSIIWGAMNAKRGSSSECRIFLPDPWVFDEPAYPDKIRSFVELPRYLAKNYTSLSTAKIAKLTGAFLINGFRHAGFRNFVSFLGLIARGLAKFGPKNIVFICGFEYLSAAAFCRQAQKIKPDLNYLFLNSLAHAQHHYWKMTDEQPLPEIIYAYAGIEKIISMIDRELGLFSGGEAMVVTNALSQTSTAKEPPWVLYRVRDMATFLTKLNISFNRVETLMSYDGHVFFENGDAMSAAKEALTEINIKGVSLFFLEPHQEQLKLFFRIDFSDPTNSETEISASTRSFPFDEEIKKIVVRTGKHNQKGVIFHNSENLRLVGSHDILNHDLFKYIYPDLFFDNPPAQSDAG